MHLRQSSVFLFLAAMIVSLSGCVFLIISGIGAVGGYAISRDTIQGEYDANYNRAWKYALETCSYQGIIISKDTTRGVIEAEVEQAKVKVEITQLTADVIRLKVKARKGIFPRIGIAERIFMRIVQSLK